MDLIIHSLVSQFMTVESVEQRGPVIIAAGQVSTSQRLPTDAISTAVLTFVGLPPDTDIVVLSAGTATVVHQVDAHPSSSYGYSYSVFQQDTVVDVGFIKQGYEVQYVRALVLPRSNSLLPIAMRVDRNFI